MTVQSSLFLFLLGFLFCFSRRTRSGWMIKTSNKTVLWVWISKCHKLRKGPGKRGHVTLLPTHCCRHKCFSVCPRAQHLLRTQILCPGHKKCFWFCSETFCVRNKRFPVCAPRKRHEQQCFRNIVSLFATALSSRQEMYAFFLFCVKRDTPAIPTSECHPLSCSNAFFVN